MTRPVRMGYLLPRFPGQTQTCFWREILALEDMGVAVDVLSTSRPAPADMVHGWSGRAAERTSYLSQLDPLAAIRALGGLAPRGVDVAMVGEGVAGPRDLMMALPAAWRLQAMARARGIDHVHVHSCGRAALVAALAARMGGPTYSLTLHGPLSGEGPAQRFKWRNASFATIVTDALHGEVAATLGGDLPPHVITQPVGVDTRYLARQTSYEPVCHGRPMRLFSCARLRPEKGHHDLLSATRQLLDMGVDVRLEIAGEDEAGGSGYRKTLEAHLKHLRLSDHAKLLGALPSEAIREKLLTADAFVLPSWHETLGVSYMEAMACGVPTIGTEAGGVTELIRDGRTGILVPPRNPGMLARAIRNFAGQPDYARALSAAGRAQVEARFRVEQGAERIAAEIRRLRSS